MAASTGMGWVGKGCLGLVGLAVLAAGLLTGGYWWSKQRRARQAELDEARYSVLCDTSRTVTEPPFLTFDGFAPAELRPLTFYLVRGGRVRQDTTVRTGRDEAPPQDGLLLPFARFRTSDTIVVATAGPNQWFYYLSGFHHYAYLHYGMLGYLGSHDCRLSETYLVNGRPGTGLLRQADGRRTPARPIPRRAAR